MEELRKLVLSAVTYCDCDWTLNLKVWARSFKVIKFRRKYYEDKECIIEENIALENLKRKIRNWRLPKKICDVIEVNYTKALWLSG